MTRDRLYGVILIILLRQQLGVCTMEEAVRGGDISRPGMSMECYGRSVDVDTEYEDMGRSRGGIDEGSGEEIEWQRR